MLQHLYEILDLLHREADPGPSFEHYEIPTASVLNCIGEEWVTSPKSDDPHWGCIDAEEFDEFLDEHFGRYGPCVVEHKGYLWVLAGDWKYPIYFRFEREKTELVRWLAAEFDRLVQPELAIDGYCDEEIMRVLPGVPGDILWSLHCRGDNDYRDMRGPLIDRLDKMCEQGKLCAHHRPADDAVYYVAG